MSHDRRRHPRFAIAADVDLGSGDNFFTGRARDISVGGLFIETDVSLPIGAALAVRLKVDGAPFSLHAEVAWALDGDDGRTVGIGVRFVDLSADARAAIEAFMARRKPMAFDMDPLTEDAPAVNKKRPPPLPGG